MPLVSTRELMDSAVAEGYGQGAFNVLHLETLEGLIAGAEKAERPLIVQISENCVKYHGALKPLTSAVLAAAAESSAAIAVHLDHAEDLNLALAAIDLGFGSVMYDGAHLPYAENVATTRKIAEYAHSKGVYVEAELGEVGGKDGAHAPGVLTDPQDAQNFVADTGIDALAVAVGSSHAMTERTAELNFERIQELHQALGVPLVLHGSSGVSDDSLVHAITSGMRKINVSTHLNGFFTGAVREVLTEYPELVDSRKYLKAGREALIPGVARLLKLFTNNR